MRNKIIHPRYGVGTIIKVERLEYGYWLIIWLDGIGEKRMLSFVNPLKKDRKRYWLV